MNNHSQSNQAHNYNVLVIDDDQRLARFCEKALKRAEFVPHVANSFEAAKALLNETEFAVVLTDIYIDAFSGLDLLEVSAALQPDTPVILMTGLPSIESATEALRLGAYEYLQKPFDREQLLNSLRRAHELYLLRLEKQAYERERRTYRRHLESLVEERTRQLAESERKYRLVFEGSKDAIFISSPQGQLLDLNDAAKTLLALETDRLETFFLEEVFVHRHEFHALQKKINHEGAIKDFEVQLKKQNGLRIFGLMTASARYDDHQNMIGYHGIIRDVTAAKAAERQIREQNLFLETILESLSHPFYVIDTQTYKILKANSAALQNGHPEHLHHCHEMIYGQSTPCHGEGKACPLELIKKNKQAVVMEHQHRLPDGRMRYVEIHGYPIFNTQGDVHQMIEYAIDITARKTAEIELLRQLKILEAVRYAAETFLKSASWEENITHVLAKIGGATAISRVYIFQHNMVELHQPEVQLCYEWTAEGISPKKSHLGIRCLVDHPQRFERWRQRLSEGQIIQGDLSDFPPAEREVMESQGILSLVIVPIFVANQWWGFMGFDECRRARKWSSAEIDALKVAAETLAAAIDQNLQAQDRLKLASAVEQSTECVVIMDHRGYINYVNPTFQRVTGYHPADVVGQAAAVFYDQHIEERRIVKSIQDHIDKGQVWHGQTGSRKKDGTPYIAEATIFPVKDHDGIIYHYVALSRDITEQKHLENVAEAANLMENIGYVFAGIRHEIGNPLNSIKMALSVLKKNLAEFTLHETENFIVRTLKEVGRMEYLLKALKNFSLYEKPDIQPISLTAFLESFLKLIDTDFANRGIRLTRTIKAPKTALMGDPRMLHHVMLNLVTNAADALADTENPSIHIESHADLGGVKLIVQDNGCGMTADETQKLFHPFYTTKTTGTGLGLVIVQNMLLKMNAYVDVQSRKAVGTKIILTLPEAPHGNANPVDGRY